MTLREWHTDRCPLCDKDIGIPLAGHLFHSHMTEQGGIYNPRACFCGHVCSTWEDVVRHFEEHGGVLDHLAEHALEGK